MDHLSEKVDRNSVKMEPSEGEDVKSEDPAMSLKKEENHDTGDISVKAEEEKKKEMRQASVCSKFRRRIQGIIEDFFMAWVSRGVKVVLIWSWTH